MWLRPIIVKTRFVNEYCIVVPSEVAPQILIKIQTLHTWVIYHPRSSTDRVLPTHLRLIELQILLALLPHGHHQTLAFLGAQMTLEVVRGNDVPGIRDEILL